LLFGAQLANKMLKEEIDKNNKHQKQEKRMVDK